MPNDHLGGVNEVNPDYPQEVLAALRAFPGEDPGSQYNRAAILSSYFQETGQRQAIDQALSLFRAAVSRMPPGHPRSGMVFTGLVSCCIIRFDAFGDTQDLAEAISWADMALSVTPPGHDDRRGVLTKHGLAYLTSHQRFGGRADLEQAGPAAAAIHRAVSALRADKPRRPDLWAPYLHIGP